MSVLYVITVVLVLLSLWADPRKTMRALRIGAKRFLAVSPAFLAMLVLVAMALWLVPDRVMTKLLVGESKWSATAIAAAVGSISIMPGFIAFPLCGILLAKGVLYMVLSAFSSTLMMVGIITFPLEKTYLGTPLALSRNAVSLLIALAVAAATGLVFGELL